MDLLKAVRLIAALVIIVPCGNLLAEESSDEGWSYSFAPYLWGTSLKGQVATLPGVPPADLDIPLSDILENLDFGLMAAFGARKGKLALYGDLFYSNISADTDTPGPLFSGAEYDQTLSFVTVGASWRLVGSKNQGYHLDGIAAARYYHINNELKFKTGLLREQKISDTTGWLDPQIGLKGRVLIGGNWYASGWAMASVFGSSNSAYDLFGGVGYVFNESYSMIGGYRYLSVDYRDGAYLFDVELAGPMLGFTVRW